MSTDWKAVSEFIEGAIEEALDNDPGNDEARLEVQIYSVALDKTVRLIIPEKRVEDFIKRLPLVEAEVRPGYQSF